MVFAGLAFWRRLPRSRGAMELIAWAGLVYLLVSNGLFIRQLLAWSAPGGLGAPASTALPDYTTRNRVVFGVFAILQALPVLGVILALRSKGVRQAFVAPARAAVAPVAASHPASPPAVPSSDPSYDRSTSADGRFLLRVTGWEAFNTQWVYCPEIIDLSTGQTIFRFQDRNWSLDQDEWETLSVVRFTLRKWPGNHQPVALTAAIDCFTRLCDVMGTQVTLDSLESELERRLTWLDKHGIINV
jgi:hypothetical protein